MGDFEPEHQEGDEIEERGPKHRITLLCSENGWKTWLYSDRFKWCAISPMIPRRNNSTQATKITP